MYCDPLGRYSITNALAYAKKWWEGKNPEYPVPEDYLDCTNFISQCLYAGGWHPDSNWYFLRSSVLTMTGFFKFEYRWVKIKISHAWGHAGGLFNYISREKRLHYFWVFTDQELYNIVNNGSLRLGSLIFMYNRDKAKIDHVVMVGRIKYGKWDGSKYGPSNAFYYGHTKPANALNDKYNIYNLLHGNYCLIIVNMWAHY